LTHNRNFPILTPSKSEFLSKHRKGFGYNSVFVRNRELRDIFNDMAAAGKLLKRPMWENKGTFLRKMAERWIPEKVRTKRFFDAIKW
jgi:coenzyme F420-reducing hydrogenase beta subunit